MVSFLRTFIAIELPQSLRARIAAHVNQLRRNLPDVRASWSREDSLHLTLKFLGDVPVARIPLISAAVDQSVRSFRSFEVSIGGCGTFPPQGRPSVLWLGIADEVSRLKTLQEAVETHCAAAGFARDSRPFHPHLTIARLRTPQGGRDLAELHKTIGFAAVTFTVSEVVVFSSELSHEGAKHTALSRHALRRDSSK